MRQLFETRLLEGEQIAKDEWRAHRFSVESSYGHQLESVNSRLEDRIKQVQVRWLNKTLICFGMDFLRGISCCSGAGQFSKDQVSICSIPGHEFGAKEEKRRRTDQSWSSSREAGGANNERRIRSRSPVAECMLSATKCASRSPHGSWFWS